MTDTTPGAHRERPEDDEVLVTDERPALTCGPGRERPEDDIEFLA
ncbi:hypothetical protein [Kocuria aegyptia]|uniref:Uncharacterized protein n=1 Tax=Kocuria aegyptia TaxID=330943 RepID=A0ABN2KP33_9MICC